MPFVRKSLRCRGVFQLLRCALAAAALLMSVPLLAKEHPAPAASAQYVPLPNAPLLALLSIKARAQLQTAVTAIHCAQSDIRGYRSPTNAAAPLVVMVSCDLRQMPEGQYSEYPVIWLVRGDDVQQITNTGSFGFIYETGTVKFVTDLDNNLQPEFWLEGDICECDVEPDDPCDCDNPGGHVVEVQGATWQLWHDGEGWNAQ